MKVINKKVSKTKIVSIIEETAGKFVSVSFMKNNKEKRKINGIFKKNSMDKQGYLVIYSLTDKGYRKINPRTIISLKSNNCAYKS